MSEFIAMDQAAIQPGEPLFIINKNVSPVEVGSAITFKQNGVYLVAVNGKQIIIEKYQPIKRGHWVKRMEEHTTAEYTSFTPIWSCSECGLEYDPAIAPRIQFCYNCGTRKKKKKGRKTDG